MVYKIPVFKTIQSSISLFRANASLYIKSLCIPLAALCFSQSFPIWLSWAHSKYSGVADLIPAKMIDLFLSFFFPLTIAVMIFSLIVIINISFRIALLGRPGNIFPKKAELKTLSCLFVMLLCTVAIQMIIGVILYKLFFLVELLISNMSIIGALLAMVLFGIVCFLIVVAIGSYIASRYLFIFPAIAIGDKIKVSRARDLSLNNGSRISMFLIPPILTVVLFDWVIFFMVGLPNPIIALIRTFLYVVLLCATSTAIAVAYKGANEARANKTTPIPEC